MWSSPTGIFNNFTVITVFRLKRIHSKAHALSVSAVLRSRKRLRVFAEGYTK